MFWPRRTWIRREDVKRLLTRWPLRFQWRMTGCVTSYDCEPSSGRRRGQIMNASVTFVFFGGGGGVHWFSWSPCWLFCLWRNCWIDRLIFRSAVSRSFILRSSLMCNPDSHSPAGFECQRGNPAWRLFWYCWTVSWKTFLLGEWGCSGFRAVGFPAEAPHLIGAVKSVEGLRMCRVSPFYVFKQNRVDLKGDRWRLKQHRDKSTLECEEGIEIFAFRAVSHIYSAWCYKHKLIVCTFWMSCCWPTLTAFTDFFCPAVWVGAQIGIRLNKWNQ